MKYDLDLYRRTIIPIIVGWCQFRPDETPISQIGAIAIGTECPIVAVAYFVEEVFGTSEELKAYIEILEKFYKVTEIKGKI